MALVYTVTPLPRVWPGEKPMRESWRRKAAPFKRSWNTTLRVLEREIWHLRGQHIEMALDIAQTDLRRDGQMYASARPKSPAVIISFVVEKHRLTFPADAYGFWQDNIDAIARTLENLRAIDRYGVQQGRQYEGYKQFPAATTATLSTQNAAEIIARHAGATTAQLVLSGSIVARDAIRRAAANTHPDRGGSADLFSLVQQAKGVIEAHFGNQS